MTYVAYVDSSAIVGMLFGERGAARLRHRYRTLDVAYASNLLEAEVRSAAARESVADHGVERALQGITWVLTDRPLGEEHVTILRHGHLLAPTCGM